MEDALAQFGYYVVADEQEVLILVLMEDALAPSKVRLEQGETGVLILVLMEDALAPELGVGESVNLMES